MTLLLGSVHMQRVPRIILDRAGVSMLDLATFQALPEVVQALRLHHGEVIDTRSCDEHLEDALMPWERMR
ncbi:MAG: hypothetical protein JOZ51_03485 [Chloroflexi bacterium]|nr:hypothetical protein [Chloroflexota bacterium]